MIEIEQRCGSQVLVGRVDRSGVVGVAGRGHGPRGQREEVYHGALLAAHREVHQRDPFRDEHFDRWYQLWIASIEARWSGPRAEKAKAHAAATAGLISRRLRGVDHHLRPPPPEPTNGRDNDHTRR